MDDSGDLEPQEPTIEVGDEDGDRWDRLSTREQVAIMRREMRELTVEWLSMYDQFRSLYGRIARRQQREEQPTRNGPDRPLNPAALALLKGGHE